MALSQVGAMTPPGDPDLRRRLRGRLLALPPRAFELFAGDLLEFMGLRQVTVTRYVGDGGVDATGSVETEDALISIPTGVQVKRHRGNVQRAEIDRFIGALVGRYAQGIFITTAGYAPQARLKAASAIPRVATVDGDQVAALMLRHRLGVAADPGGLDEGYFAEYEAQAQAERRGVAERREAYRAAPEAGQAPRPEEDLLSLRALSHALRVDSGALRRWMEQGRLRPDLPQAAAPGGGHFFRRDRVEAIRSELLLAGRPASNEQWRQEFLDFARSRNLSKSYKPVLVLALLRLVDRDGVVRLDALAREFRAFYAQRRLAGLPVEFGGPPLDDQAAVGDAQLRQLIVRHPLERFLIKGFLEYLPAEGLVRFAPQLWADLRHYELLDVRRSAEEQLRYYYARGAGQ
jgi:hypothetical protein